MYWVLVGRLKLTKSQSQNYQLDYQFLAYVFQHVENIPVLVLLTLQRGLRLK